MPLGRRLMTGVLVVLTGMTMVLVVLVYQDGVKRVRERNSPAAIERRARIETWQRGERVRDVRYFRRGQVCVGVTAAVADGYGWRGMFAVPCDILVDEDVIEVPPPRLAPQATGVAGPDLGAGAR